MTTTGITPAYIQWLTQQQTIKYCRVAPMSIWMLDYLLTLDEEVRLMTNKRSWGITHILYIPTRYLPMIGSLCSTYNALVVRRPHVTCVALYRVAEILLFLGMFTAEGLLLIRTTALWNHRKTIRLSLALIYCIVGIVMFVCSAISISLKFSAICAETSSSVTTATATTLSRVTVGMFSSAAFFELVVLGLTLLHAYSLRQSGFSARGKVVSAITRGNIVYTLLIFLTSVGNITFFVLPLEDGWNGLLATFQGVLHGVVASRVLFNLRDALQHQEDADGTCVISNIQFATIPLRSMTRDVKPSSSAHPSTHSRSEMDVVRDTGTEPMLLATYQREPQSHDPNLEIQPYYGPP